jgi:hypothetical protein
MSGVTQGLIIGSSILAAAVLGISIAILVVKHQGNKEVEEQNRLLNQLSLPNNKEGSASNSFQVVLVNNPDYARENSRYLQKIDAAEANFENVEAAAKLMTILHNTLETIKKARKDESVKLDGRLSFIFDDSFEMKGVNDVDYLFNKCKDAATSHRRERGSINTTSGDIYKRIFGKKLVFCFNRVPEEKINILCSAIEQESNSRVAEAQSKLEKERSRYKRFQDRIMNENRND